MNRALAAIAVGLGALVISAPRVDAAVILTDASLGYYNDNLATILDNSAGFPCADILCGDPTVPPIAPVPDLTAAAAILGAWLGATPLPLNANWSAAPQAIPTSWPINSETAMLFEIVVAMPTQLTASFGVDNGVYVWVDGSYRFGAMAGGPGDTFEYSNIDLGVLAPGTHYLQILREDHGVLDDWQMSIDAVAVPEPTGLLLLIVAGSAAGARFARTRRHA